MFSHGKKTLTQLNLSQTRLQKEKVRFSLLVTTTLLSIKTESWENFSHQVNDVVMYFQEQRIKDFSFSLLVSY